MAGCHVVDARSQIYIDPAEVLKVKSIIILGNKVAFCVEETDLSVGDTRTLSIKD